MSKYLNRASAQAGDIWIGAEIASPDVSLTSLHLLVFDM